MTSRTMGGTTEEEETPPEEDEEVEVETREKDDEVEGEATRRERLRQVLSSARKRLLSGSSRLNCRRGAAVVSWRAREAIASRSGGRTHLLVRRVFSFPVVLALRL